MLLKVSFKKFNNVESTISEGYSSTANTNSEFSCNSGGNSFIHASTSQAVCSLPNSSLEMLGCSSGTSASFNTCNYPVFIEAREVGETIEFLYEQTSMVTLTIYPSPPPAKRVFKIVYSCKDGKWHKSEPIYGKIIPASDEYYEFEDPEN